MSLLGETCEQMDKEKGSHITTRHVLQTGLIIIRTIPQLKRMAQ